VNSTAATSTINVTAVNDAPVINLATLVVNSGQSVLIDNTMLSITDVDTTAIDIDIQFSDIAGGHFALISDLTTALTDFTAAQLNNNEIYFVQSGSTPPSYKVAVGDDQVAVSSVTPIRASDLTFNGLKELDSTANDIAEAWAPVGSTIVDNGNSTSTITTLNGSEITVVNDSVSTIFDNGTTATIDFNSDGIIDVTVPSGATVVDNGNNTQTVIINNKEITLTSNSKATVSDAITDQLGVDIGSNSIVDVFVPTGTTIEDNLLQLLVTTSSGDHIIVDKNSKVNIIATALNIFNSKTAANIEPNVQNTYVIGGPLSDANTTLVNDRDNIVTYAQAFAGFEDSTFNIHETNFQSGLGTVESPLINEIQNGKKILIASLLSSDIVSARILGITPDKGKVEVTRSANKLDISFIANPNFSGKVDFVFEIYHRQQLLDQRYFGINVILTPDVLTNLSNRNSQGFNITSDPLIANTFLVKDSFNKPVLLNLPTLATPPVDALLKFTEALAADSSVLDLKDVAGNIIQESGYNSYDQVVGGVLQQMINAREPESNIGIIAASVVDTSLDIGISSETIVKSIVQSVTDSRLSLNEAANVISYMIQGVNREAQSNIMTVIAHQSNTSEDFNSAVHGALQKLDPALAEQFMTIIQQNQRKAIDEVELETRSSVESHTNQGILIALKNKLLGNSMVDKDAQTFSEAEQRYKLAYAKANLLALDDKNKQNNPAKKS
uniref:cadherin-like domain-containing protein n=1 Tax=Cysteiniphilum halobium TaxID=2219059 RepID=UPI0013C34B39